MKTKPETRQFDRTASTRLSLSLLQTGVRMLSAAAFAALPLAASAQGFPNRPVKIIVPFPAGGAVDILARTIAHKLSESLNQPVIIDNRGGANGNIGTEAAAKSPADGYTLLMAPTSFLTNPMLYKSVNYHPLRSFTPIATVAAVPNVVVVHPAVAATSLKELLSLAKTRPGELSYGSSGAGSTQHLSAEMLKSIGKIDILHVPYKGSGPALTDLVGGQISVMVTAIPAAIPFIKSGQLRPLAVMEKKRVASLPDVPTAAEAGLPELEISNWVGMFAPAGTPADVVELIYQKTAQIQRSAEFRNGLQRMGAEPFELNPQEFAALMRSDQPKYERITQSFGAKLD